MLMMRSSSVTKTAKPPPPVPPRPSKTIVAEALAKRRRNPEDTNTVPVRTAPPPPPDLGRSQSNGRLNFPLKSSSTYDRSISDELKSNSRTVVFQSSNMKCANNNVLVKIDSFNNKTYSNQTNVNDGMDDGGTNNKVTSEVHQQTRKNNVIVNAKNILNSCDIALKTNCIKITQVEDDKSSLRHISESSDSTEEVTVNSEYIVTCLIPNREVAASDNTQSKNCEITDLKTTELETTDLKRESDSCEDNNNGLDLEGDSNKRSSFDEKWEDMLKDKNHVNMLIDEMFASVLEVSKNEESNKQSYKVTSATTTLSTDSAKIAISSCDNNYDSSYNVESNGPTVLVIESSDDDFHIDKKFCDSLTKTKGSMEKLAFSYDKSNSSTIEKKSVQFDDKKNAELLIEELESMRMEQERILKRQRKPSQEIYDAANGQECDNDDGMKNCHINIVNLTGSGKGTMAFDYERLKTMSSLHGLPPLPKSLSGFNLNENFSNPPTPVRTTSMRSHQGPPSSLVSGHIAYGPHKGLNGGSELSSMVQGRKQTNLDTQLAILRREMYSLRQLDLSLLSQLWSLNESIQDFRQILQDQEDCRVLSPPSPSPAPSSCDEGDGEEQYYMNTPSIASMKFRPAPPPPPARRSSNSSNASTGG